MVWGVCGSLSEMTMADGRSAAVCGLKVMVSVQLAEGASVEPQVLVMAKLVSRTVMLESASAAAPVLVSVTVCARLVWPTAAVNERATSERASCGRFGGGV